MGRGVKSAFAGNMPPFCFCRRVSLLVQLVPSLIELSFVTLNVFLEYVVRSVTAPGAKGSENGLSSKNVLRLHPVNRLIGHIHGEVVIKVVRRFHTGRAVKNRRGPLINTPPMNP